jgi:glucose-6-phosphate 1-dehydrogenase
LTPADPRTAASDDRENGPFGASGDLTSRLLMLAVAQLADAGLLPPGFTVLGSANTDWSTDDFRQHIADELDKHAPVASATRDAIVRMLSFAPADVTRPGLSAAPQPDPAHSAAPAGDLPDRPLPVRRARPPGARSPLCHLILDMLNSNPMLFIRGDEAEEAWRIIDPVTKAWTAEDVLMQEYPAGQTPPGPSS